MKKLTRLTILCLLVLLPSGKLFARNMKQDVYGISPPTTYKYIKLLPRDIASIGDSCPQEGLMYVTTEGELLLCKEESSSSDTSWQRLSTLWAQEGDLIYLVDNRTASQEFRIGVGTEADECEYGLTIKNDGGILAEGELNYGTTLVANTAEVPIDTGYPLFLWHDEKGALVAMETVDESASYSSFEDIVGFNATMFGHGNVATGRASFAAGEFNRVNSFRSVIMGGQNNTIDVPASMYDDGLPWTETGPSGIFNAHKHARTTSVIMGGLSNSIYGLFNFIGGGTNNQITRAIYAGIGGGTNNLIEDTLTDAYMANTLNDSGSETVYTQGTRSIILGGTDNSISSKGAAIGGGSENVISSSNRYNAILGGEKNAIIGASTGSAIAGGQENAISGDFSAIGGGYLNTVEGNYSTIISGFPLPSFSGSTFTGFFSDISNTISGGNYNAIGGGAFNRINGEYSVIPGGYNNKITGNYGFIGTPLNSKIEANYGAVLSRGSGYVQADYGLAAQATTADSTVSGQYSVALQNGTVSGDYALLFNADPGNAAQNNADRTFAFTYRGTIPNTSKDAFVIYDGSGSHPPKVGIGKENPQETLDVNGTIRTETLIVQNTGGLGTKKGLYFDTGTAPWTLYRQNDLAETFPAEEPVEPGDVLVASRKNPGSVIKSSSPYDKSVIGIVSASPAVVFRNNEIVTLPDEMPLKTTDPAVALAGRVLIKVCTENGNIQPGDLLTTSSQHGTAMKVTDKHMSQHAIVAKALQSYASNDPEKTGAILAIVTGQ